jgi:hypothetical protein
MELNSWPGAIAVILAVISFYGTTYAVISLNVGWRFGYWLASACFGALMVMLSLFWVLNIRPDQAVGPQGALPAWIPIVAGEELEPAEFRGETMSVITSYPAGAFEPAEQDDPRVDAFTSAVGNCVSTDPEDLAEEEQAACEEAQKFMPAATDIPVIDGAAVAVIPQVKEVRFAEEGAVVGAAEVHPITTDPRVAEDPEGELLADPFLVAAVLDKGSVGLPSIMSLVIFTIYAAFHLWGLHRAERRKLNPVVT